MLRMMYVTGGFGYANHGSNWCNRLISLYGITNDPFGKPFIVSNPVSFLEEQNAIHCTTWETTRLRSDCVSVLNSRDIVIVPCQQNKEDFTASGITRPIHVVPEGTDATFRLPAAKDYFLFSTLGEVHGVPERKRFYNIPYLFSCAFPKQKDVRLEIKLTPNCPTFPVFDSRVTVHRARWSREEVLNYIARADCGVFLSGAEGWGLCQLEYMATGRCIISPIWGGIKEFFNCGIPVTTVMRRAPIQVYHGIGDMAYADDDSFIDCLRWVYSNPLDTYRRGLADAEHAKKFTWEFSVSKLMDVLTPVLENASN